MSLILDALNRSRQDSEQMPGLSTDHFVDPPATTDINWVLWLLVGGLTAAVVAIGWLLFDRLPQSIPAAQAPAEIEAAQTAAALPVPERPVPPAQSTPRAVPEQQRSPVAAAPATPQPRQRMDIPAQAEAETPVALVDPSVAALYQQQGQTPPAAAQARARPTISDPASAAQPSASSRDEQAIDLESLVVAAETELADARLSEHEIPLLSALSQQSKDAIPTLMYLRHDYSGNPAKSSVVINGETLKAGGSVTGVKVLEILPDSVVLEAQGNRFRLRALNSWVNL